MSSDKLQEDICASNHSSKEEVRIEMILQSLSSLLAGNRVLGFRIDMPKSTRTSDKIIGYDGIKRTFIRSLDSEHGTGSGNQTFTVTNKMAWFDGLVNGWKHWCNTDLSLCAKYALSNVFPGQLANNQKSIYLCLKDGSDNASGPDNVLPPPQLSKHCEGVVSDISGPWIVVRPHPFNPAIYANSTNFVQNVTKES